MPQQNKKISSLQAAGIIGFAACVDLFQGIGQWAITFVVGVAGTVLTLGIGAAPSAAIGIVMGSVFSLLMSTIAGVGLSWMFSRLKVPFAVKVGSAALFETVPYLNTLPAWTLAATQTVLSANGASLGGILNTGLSVFGGATSIANKAAAATTPASIRAAQMARQQKASEAPGGLPTRAVNAPLQIDGIRSANDNTATRYTRAA